MVDLIYLAGIQTTGDQTVIDHSTTITTSKVNTASNVNIQFAEAVWKVSGNLGDGSSMLIGL